MNDHHIGMAGNQIMTTNLERVVRESGARQITLHKVAGGVWIVTGALFAVLSVFVEGKPDEQHLRVLAGVLGVASVVGGALYIRQMTARVRQLVELLLTRKSELKDAGIVRLRRRGIVITHVISVRDASNRRYKMRVSTEADARAMLAGIPSE